MRSNAALQRKDDSMSQKNYLFSGDFISAQPEPGELSVHENSYAWVRDGILIDFTSEKPDTGEDVVEVDCRGKLIIPAFTDIHLHAVQYVTTGLGYDRELLSWLTEYTFPEEARFAEPAYAERVFRDLVRDLWSVGSLHSSVFCSMNADAAIQLTEALAAAGLSAFVGKVNMDRHGGVNLEETTEGSMADTIRFLERMIPFENRGIRPIVTPRFAPSCSKELMRWLGKQVSEKDLPVQSHVNENKEEIEWVRQLFPESGNYLSVYRDYGLLPKQKTVMAHCVYNTEEEVNMMKELDVLAAHCPASNANIASGIMPASQLIDKGIRIGLGSDIGGGNRLFLGFHMALAMKESRLLWVQTDRASRVISFAEAFWMGTAAGGSFFGKTGAFLPGYSFDALVIDDSHLSRYRPLNVCERLQRFIFAGDDRQIEARYLRGERLPDPRAVVK